MPQSKNSIPEYKEILMAELKDRLGRFVVPHVAAKASYSDSYVRSWFNSARINDHIKSSAIDLLDELKAEERKTLEVISQ